MYIIFFIGRTPALTDLLGGALIQALAWVPPNGLVIVSASDIYYQVVINAIVVQIKSFSITIKGGRNCR